MKLTNRFALLGLAVASLAIASVALADRAEKDIVDTAVGAGQFTTLTKLVQQAGLVDALKGEGPFTVFAPTDEAFKKVPEETLNAVAADKELLKSVLLYHVVQGKVTSDKVVSLQSADTLLKVDDKAVKLKVAVTDEGVVLNDNVKVIKTDVMASNGVIHVLDGVLIPPMGGDAAPATKPATCTACPGGGQ